MNSVGGQWQFTLEHHSILSEFLPQTVREKVLIYSYFTSVRSVSWQNDYDLPQNVIQHQTMPSLDKHLACYELLCTDKMQLEWLVCIDLFNKLTSSWIFPVFSNVLPFCSQNRSILMQIMAGSHTRLRRNSALIRSSYINTKRADALLKLTVFHWQWVCGANMFILLAGGVGIT